MTDASPTEIARKLESTIKSMRSTLSSIDEAFARHKPSSDRWSIAEVVGHLVDSACNNHQRFVRAQFVDSLEFPKYEQNEWVHAGRYQDSEWQSLVELWFHYNRHLAVVIAGIDDSKLSTPCTITPYETCTLHFLLQDYVDHLNHHLRKIHERLVT